MAEHLLEKTARLAREAAERSRLKKEQEQKPLAESSQKSRRTRRSGKATTRVMQSAQDGLERFARQQGIQQFDLFPGGEFPTPLTRLPLFPPVRRSTAREALAESTKTSDWMPLESRWDGGGVSKNGPPLTIYDEDTLIGLMRLRSNRLTGPAGKMPVPAPGPAQIGLHDEAFFVHSTYCLISQLESAVQGYTPKKGWGGRAIQKRRESVERISATTLRFEKIKNREVYRGQNISLIYIEWIGSRDDACYYVQFHPLVSAWLEEYRTFIDMDLRRQLSDIGKALYRFLASQTSNKCFRMDLMKIYQATGCQGSTSDLNRKAKVQLLKMQEHGFLLAYEITGTGRRNPFTLNIKFP